MAEHEKSLVKSSNALTRFDPKARKELVVRALNALTEVKDADFYFFKGEEHRMRGELKLAISYYEKALEFDPEHEDSLFWTGYCYMPEVVERKGDDLDLDHPVRHKKAIAAFQKLIAIRVKKDSIWWWGDYVMHYNLGLSQYDLGLYDEAIESYEQAIELNPDHDSYYNLGTAQYRLGLDEEATESFEQAIELNPDHANSYYNLGLSQENLGIYHLALENFETFLNLDATEKSKDPCVEYAKNRVEPLKGLLTDTYYYNIGCKFWKKNEYKQAIECYERAIELNPNFADAYYNLALAQEKMAETTYSQPVLFDESDWKESIYELHRMALDNFEKYLRLEDNEVAENEQFITYANQQVNELKEMFEAADIE